MLDNRVGMAVAMDLEHYSSNHRMGHWDTHTHQATLFTPTFLIFISFTKKIQNYEDPLNNQLIRSKPRKPTIWEPLNPYI